MLRYQYSDYNEFGIRLRHARKDAGLTLQTCADKLNSRYGMSINKGSISKYENGIHEPSMSLVHCFSEVLGVNRDYLLGRVEDPSIDDDSHLFEFVIRDDSMIPRYLPEDNLLINKNIKPQNGMYCLVISGQGIRLIRRLGRNRYGWVLSALNNRYEDIIIGFVPLTEIMHGDDKGDHGIISKSDIKCMHSYKIEGIVTEIRRRELFSEPG